METKREPSNPRIYTVGKEENEDQKKKRMGKIEKDVGDRLQLLAQHTGARQFNRMNPARIEKMTFIRVLVEAGLTTEDRFTDIYHRIIDEEIQDMEETKDEIKAKVDEQKAKAAGNTKGIHLPPGYNQGKNRGIIKA